VNSYLRPSVLLLQVVRCKSKIKAIAFSSKKAKLETQISVALNNNSVEVCNFSNLKTGSTPTSPYLVAMLCTIVDGYPCTTWAIPVEMGGRK